MDKTTEHPYLTLIRNLGCTDDIKIMMAFQSYLDLSEVHAYFDVKCFYNEATDVIYLVAKKFSSSEENIYVPVQSEFQISMRWIENVRKHIAEEKCIILIVRDRDSSCTLIKVTPGLVRPLSPETTTKQSLLSQKEHCIQNEIKKHHEGLYEQAKAKKTSNED